MKWLAEWQALSKRIDRLREGANFIVNCDVSIGSAESAKAIMEHWLPTIDGTARDLGSFLERHRQLLPSVAQQACQEYQWLYKAHFSSPRPSGNPIQKMQYALSILLAFQAKLDHLIGDFELFARRTIERSFVHLQRMLVVDDSLRSRWLKEFQDKGEVGVEKLGAVHLLAHGIWAFKVDAAGERTDLILGEPIKNVHEDIARTAEVMALTEWKVVKENNKSSAVAASALKQAKLYAAGSLAGLEIERWRYLVLVSLKRLHPIEDIIENGITYRHINIAINPVSPSRQ